MSLWRQLGMTLNNTPPIQISYLPMMALLSRGTHIVTTTQKVNQCNWLHEVAHLLSPNRRRRRRGRLLLHISRRTGWLSFWVYVVGTKTELDVIFRLREILCLILLIFKKSEVPSWKLCSVTDWSPVTLTPAHVVVDKNADQSIILITGNFILK